MKFLIICTVKDTLATVPPAIQRQLIEGSVAWYNQRRQAGKILEGYMTAGSGRLVVICEHESAEDLDPTISALPMAGFMDYEVYPLVDLGEALKAVIDSTKRAEQLFPAAPK